MTYYLIEAAKAAVGVVDNRGTDNLPDALNQLTELTNTHPDCDTFAISVMRSSRVPLAHQHQLQGGDFAGRCNQCDRLCDNTEGVTV